MQAIFALIFNYVALGFGFLISKNAVFNAKSPFLLILGKISVEDGLDAPTPLSRSFRPLPPGLESGISTLLLRACFVIEIQGSCLFLTFGPSARSMCLLWPLLTSVNPSPRLTTKIAFRQINRPPRVMRTCLHAYARRIYFHTFRTGIGL
jgi:hypothetical protein